MRDPLVVIYGCLALARPDFNDQKELLSQAKDILSSLEKEGYMITSLAEKVPVAEHPLSNPIYDQRSPIIQSYFDGNGNAINEKPGLAQWRLYAPNGKMFPGIKEFPVGTPNMTNNFLEYQALIACLETLLDSSIQWPAAIGSEVCNTEVIIKGDSMLVVQQTNGAWRVKEQHLIPLRDRAQALLAECRTCYKSVELRHCPSAENLCDPHK